MIDIRDNGGGVLRLCFLTDAGALFSLPLSNQIFCLCSSFLSAFWHLPLSVPPLLSPGRIPAMASKGKARGELTAFPAVSVDQLQHADALLWNLANTQSRAAPRSAVTSEPPYRIKHNRRLVFAEVFTDFSICSGKLLQLVNLEDAPRSSE